MGCQPDYSGANSACTSPLKSTRDGSRNDAASGGAGASTASAASNEGSGVASVAAAGCVDTYAACPTWGPSSCTEPGVSQYCPCMCSLKVALPSPLPSPAAIKPSPRPPSPSPNPIRPPSPSPNPIRPPSPSPNPIRPPSPSPNPIQPPSPSPNPIRFSPSPPRPAPSPSPSPSGRSVADYISAQQWDQLFPNRNDGACQGAASNFYNYNAFITAAAAFPGFGTASTNAVINKRELAAFLGQISHETTGGWSSAPGGPYAWGLCFITEGGSTPPSADYCSASAQYPCAAGKKYFGRGPIQLSWNYNYIPAGHAIGFDGLNNPEVVASNPVIAFKTAIWFWMTTQSPKPSCHDVMIGKYTPTAADASAGRVAGYGLTTNIINGGLECGKGASTPQELDRVGFYQRYCGILGVTPDSNLYCANQLPYVADNPPAPSPSPPAPLPSPPAPGPVDWQTTMGVSYHMYEGFNFPPIPEAGVPGQYLPGSNPGYNINGLYCTDYMANTPSVPWSSVGWTATKGIASGALKCGDRVCIRNRRNGLQTTAYVVDQGGAGSPVGFDLDYAGVFRVLDPDWQNYLRGSMDIDWGKC